VIARYEGKREEERNNTSVGKFVIVKTAQQRDPAWPATMAQTPRQSRSFPGGTSNQRLLRIAFGLYRFCRRRLSSRVRKSVEVLPFFAADLQLFVLSCSMLDLAWKCTAPLDGVQGLLLLLDAVHLRRESRGLTADGGGDGRDLVRGRDDVRLVAGSSREISGSNDGSRLDG